MGEDRLPIIFPGEILREEFLVPMGITAYRLSRVARATNKKPVVKTRFPLQTLQRQRSPPSERNRLHAVPRQRDLP